MKFTKEQIAEAKKKHGDVFLLEFEEGNTSALIKKPTRQQVSFAMSLGNDALKKTESLLTQCWIDGDKVIREEAGYLIGAAPMLDEIIEVKTAEVKKL